ncbi:MAG: glycosyl hydrolase 115 family protein [Pontiellaceae bacterium]|nr:glycosyl hydrolase 115 family protein [Pontiellaceae bacterium]
MKRVGVFVKSFWLTGFVVGAALQVQAGISLSETLISEEAQSKAFPLVADGAASPLFYDSGDHKGVIRAVQDLQADIERVSDKRPRISSNAVNAAHPVLIGTLGQSALIDQLVESGKLNAQELKGAWESFLITTIDQPFDGVEQALVIVGSDKRGTIYGIYELSEQLGVSPWYWWADVPPQKRTTAYVAAGRYASGEPKVKYRGIFINDENPCMQLWAREKFGGINHEMYSHMFELMLRLRANLLWPGMWGTFKEHDPNVPIFKGEDGNFEGNCFNEDDPENARLADEYGIIMGTSHHEPMQRSQQEWLRHKDEYGNGEWNYLTNKEGLQQFFRDGIENTKNYESLITMGMRGDEDKPMVDAGSASANFRMLEGIMNDQRRIIEEVTGKPAAETPQIWTLYKEVLEYYDQGMNVPDDMIIVLCDDNWGDVRRLPDLGAEKHPGGYGMYYHAGYYGAPRACKWLSVTQIPQVWEQMQLTYDYGVDKLWILNVGDLKPNEYPMDFFLRMTWNPDNYSADNLGQYSEAFCAQQFGESFAAEAALILDTYCKYAGRVTPEMLDEKTYDLPSGEFKQVRDEFLALEARALRQLVALPEERHNAYKQLILYPVQALANLYDLYYSVAMNRKLAAEKDPLANVWADRVEACFERDAELTFDYNHQMADGKWNHMMDQPHIGYTTWHGPEHNIMPKVSRVTAEEARSGGYLFAEDDGVVVMEAEHYFVGKHSEDTAWTVIPDMGRTLSGLALMPRTELTDGAELHYRIKLNTPAEQVRVRIVLDSTMPFKEDAHSIAVGFEGAEEKAWKVNDDLVWANNYSKLYPTGAARINEVQTTLKLPESADGWYTLVVRPLDPGMVFHKVIVDLGGYKNTYLKMDESPYTRP